ncbi:hypothetical protein OAR36_07925 [Pseudomonadales bacterium]|nr:hypothetical protein [Pseudomonadales bacterium]
MNKKKIYSRSWQGIEFSSFANLSKCNLADSSFYDKFYEQLFSKYSCYEDLDQEWLDQKSEIVNFLSCLALEHSRLLSIGCGLGFIEAKLWDRRNHNLEIHVQDFSELALKWISEIIPRSNIHGREWPCGKEFDVIYLGAVDYALDDISLVSLLKEAELRLCDSGNIVLISASFYDDASPLNVIKMFFKDAIKILLEGLGLFDRGQFWGWLRSREDYRGLLSQAGFAIVDDGFIESPLQQTYFIKAAPIKSALQT